MPEISVSCTECSTTFLSRRSNAKRCSDECRRKYAIRRIMETRDPKRHVEIQQAYYRRNKAKKSAYDLGRKQQVAERRRQQAHERYLRNRAQFISNAGRRHSIYEQSNLTPADVKRVFRKSAGRCQYCRDDTAPLELEHVMPLSRGGRHAKANVVAACRTCNRQKSNKTVMEWRVWRRSIGLPDISA